jgi:GntR family transcriptional regulator
VINIDYRDKRPIYEQLIESIEDMTIRGILEPDSQLMPVRQLALELSINPNTIQRAYAELERKGIIYSVKGRGNFISGDIEKLRAERKRSVFNELHILCEKAAAAGIEKDELLSQCKKFFEEERGGKE